MGLHMEELTNEHSHLCVLPLGSPTTWGVQNTCPGVVENLTARVTPKGQSGFGLQGCSGQGP